MLFVHSFILPVIFRSYRRKRVNSLHSPVAYSRSLTSSFPHSHPSIDMDSNHSKFSVEVKKLVVSVTILLSLSISLGLSSTNHFLLKTITKKYC